MRDQSGWHHRLAQRLRPWPEDAALGVTTFLDVELGLYLLTEVAPDWSALDAWTLFTGYPFTTGRGLHLDQTQHRYLERARFYLTGMRRRRWRDQLTRYQRLSEGVRGFHFEDATDPPHRRDDPAARQRFDAYRELLLAPPLFRAVDLPIAMHGGYRFWVRNQQHSVRFDSSLPHTAPVRYDLNGRHDEAKPITVTRDELYDCAATMDARESAGDVKANHWVRRLQRIELRIRSKITGAFEAEPNWTLTIDGLLHLVGMVGAGKSTLRDILTVFCVRNRGLRVGILVSDVAETLHITRVMNNLAVPTAPIIGRSTRQRHIYRLHRRQHTSGAPTMLHHDDPGFAYLSSACPADALRGYESARPLGIAETPCVTLYPHGDDDSGSDATSSRRHGCPLWAGCPKHRASRDLVDASVWVANPASLMHSQVPEHQSDVRLRYFEMMARRCDLIIIDEADRVQLHFDTAFAPAVTLYGRGTESWLDEITTHQVNELRRSARAQLSDGLIEDWIAATGTVNAAANRIFAMLLQDRRLREWVRVDYFSAFTLHYQLLTEWFGDDIDFDVESGPVGRASRILGEYRDDPMQPRGDDGRLGAEELAAVNELVEVTLELLSLGRTPSTTRRLRRILRDLAGLVDLPEAEMARRENRLEFTLLLAALHHRLNFLTWSWRAVEAALNLEATSNVLSHSPPPDYQPIMPESPMGNILGFQFIMDEPGRGESGGILRFFRCEGLGRQLLRRLDGFCQIDELPRPHVMLMSATSWAGTSSRYHLNVPVGAVLRPRDTEIEAIARTVFRKEPLYSDDDMPLWLSGQRPADRPAALRMMLKQLAEPTSNLTGARSRFAQELDEISDPDRRRILVLTGSYAEARDAAEYLDGLPEWRGRVVQLLPDDADRDDTWTTLRRGDIADFAVGSGELLVAPLLAVERGHNIVVDGGKAAIGSVYFLARPHHRPNDINLSIHALNDWALRAIDNGEFVGRVRHASSADAAGVAFREVARRKWRRLLARRLAWSNLDDIEREAFTWDQLVVIWQVIGRLVRGGVPARVTFVDAAFFPEFAAATGEDSPQTSLLLSMREVLEPYFADDGRKTTSDCSLVRELYLPLHTALSNME